MTRRVPRAEFEAADVIEDDVSDEVSDCDSRIPPDIILERLHKDSQSLADWLNNSNFDDERQINENPVSEWDMFHGGRSRCSSDLPYYNGVMIY